MVQPGDQFTPLAKEDSPIKDHVLADPGPTSSPKDQSLVQKDYNRSFPNEGLPTTPSFTAQDQDLEGSGQNPPQNSEQEKKQGEKIIPESTPLHTEQQEVPRDKSPPQAPEPALDLDALSKQHEEDPFSIINSLLEGTLFSSKLSLSTKTSESSTHHRVQALVGKLRHLVFSQDLMTTLNDDINCQIRDILVEIKKLPEGLPLEQDEDLGVFCSWYDSLTLTLNRINENEALQETVEKDEKALRVQLLQKNSKFQSSYESLLKGESRTEVLGMEIEDLKQQLAFKTEEYTLLTSALPKCGEQ
ncbi:putative TMV resistance protein N-like isoform X1 [Sesbania bispinosa]|nr:putative TMV resistance protein N-like isoform X1 [Sesbania bispinosa]